MTNVLVALTEADEAIMTIAACSFMLNGPGLRNRPTGPQRGISSDMASPPACRLVSKSNGKGRGRIDGHRRRQSRTLWSFALAWVPNRKSGQGRLTERYVYNLGFKVVDLLENGPEARKAHPYVWLEGRDCVRISMKGGRYLGKTFGRSTG